MNKTIFALLVLFFTFSSPLHAASSVLVWPIFQVIEAEQKASALWLENRGSQPVTLQLRTLAWQQQGYRDKYADQNEVVASPPFATVPPGQRQLIRLIRTSPPPTQTEKSFRIIIDEVPAAGTTAAKDSAGLKLQMRYVLPLFLNGAGAANTATPRLHWKIIQQGARSYLRIRNDGPVHARLSNVFWGFKPAAAQASLVMSKGFLGYVLPGQEMQFPLPPGKAVPLGNTLWAQLTDNSAPVAIAQ